ncbi:MAG: polymer-forming cytoskeletal protein [Lachnospiraceae bacterium]|nr:polymer-forming cytoskeletal protein [Lachnospiraceae bacterium]
MGFFSDLKDDISQAVNEMVPEEEAKAEAAEAKSESKVDSLDLDALLDNLNEAEAPAPQAPVYEEPKNTMKASNETATITAGMAIAGDVVSSGSLELLGTVQGNITINGKLNVVGTIEGDSKAAEIYAENAKITGEINSRGSVKIGQSSVIIGNIFATSAVIAGAVKGDIDVKGPVVLDTSAIVMGNIKSKSVQINNGAVIEGVCSQCYADVSPTTFFDEFKKNKNK